jgi:hypothetical protein
VLRVWTIIFLAALAARLGLRMPTQMARPKMSHGWAGEDVVPTTGSSMVVIYWLVLERPGLKIETLAHR